MYVLALPNQSKKKSTHFLVPEITSVSVLFRHVNDEKPGLETIVRLD